MPPGSLLQEFSQSLALLRMPLFTFLSGCLFAMRPVEIDVRRAYHRLDARRPPVATP